MMGDGARAFPFVLHVDLDQFIAAVEVLRHPELAGREVVVGGRGDPTERAVVSTASYEARERGVRSGMPLRVAAGGPPTRCSCRWTAPHYLAASAEVVAAVRGLGLVVEVLGWDEMFVGAETDDPEGLARRIQAAVLERTRLHCSVGVGDTRVRAKIATDFGKPRGVFRLTARNWAEVMGHRPVAALWGVGPGCRLGWSASGSARSTSSPTPTSACSSPSSARGWVRGTARSGAARAAPRSTTPPGWRAATAARPPTSRTSASRRRSATAVRVLTDEVLEDVRREGRPVQRDRAEDPVRPVLHRQPQPQAAGTHRRRRRVHDAVQGLLADHLEEGREVRLLGVRAEMTMPDDGDDDVERTPVRGRV